MGKKFESGNGNFKKNLFHEKIVRFIIITLIKVDLTEFFFKFSNRKQKSFYHFPDLPRRMIVSNR